MNVNKYGLHFANRNAFWADLLMLYAWRTGKWKEHWERRGPKLFFSQCWEALKEWWI